MTNPSDVPPDSWRPEDQSSSGFPAPPPPGAYQPPQPGYEQGAQQPGYPEPGYQQPGYQQPAYGQPGYQQPGYPPMYGQPAYGGYGTPPDNGLVWGILTTLFCCLPLGIVSIVKASQVNTLWSTGQVDAARKAAADAKRWAMWSAIAAPIFFVIVYGLIAAGTFMAPTTYNP